MSETKRLGRGLEALLGPVSREQAEASGALRELATSSISRVLPVPPVPMSVTSRCRSTSSRRSARSRSRPTNDVS